ncbi:MAG: metallophosphoesterase [Candidatus Hydrogenedens sp.]
MKIAITSDIHLGDNNSKLNMNSSGNDIFYKFMELLYEHPHRGPIDYLILNGDILDFSINSFENSCNTAKKFFREIKNTQKEGRDIVKEIIYIPGNHDKHIWDAVEWEVSVIRRLKKHKDVKPFKRTQPGIIDLSTNSGDKRLIIPGVRYVERKSRYGDLFLEGLFQDVNNKLPINIVYPNLYIKVNNSIYIVTHGHMFDTPWVLLSELLEGWENIKCTEIQHFEEYNYPLTSMICTGVGQGGDVSELLYRILIDIRENKKTTRLEHTLAYMLSRLSKNLGENKFLALLKSQKVDTFITKIIIGYFLRGKGIENPRNNKQYFDIQKNSNKKERLKKFYEASFNQLKHISENNEQDNFKKISIIFGHTHIANKAIKKDTLSLDGINLDIYNTGGVVKRYGNRCRDFLF